MTAIGRPEPTSAASVPAEAIVFSPIGAGGLVQQTVRRLGEAIGFGLLTPGERLPTETALAERLDISVMTLREALAVLRENGYIETRRGRGGGTYVVHTTPEPPADELARARFDSLTVEELQDMTDYRTAISVQAARLAAERATAEDVEVLRSLVVAMGKAKTMTEWRPLDARFHVTIATASRSPRLARSETDVQAELNPITFLFKASTRLFTHSNREHAAMVDAIEARDADQAGNLVRQHVSGTTEAMIGLRLGSFGKGDHPLT